MINILITSASRKVSLVKAFKSALKKEGGGKVIAGDSSPFSAAFFGADAYCILPKISEKSFLKKFIAICKKNRISLVVPTRDEELPVYARYFQNLKENGITVMVASEKTIEICADKEKFFNFCAKNNFCHPKFYKNNEAGDLNFPLFVNDRFGSGGKSAFKVDNQKELKLRIGAIRHPVISEFISAKEYTVDLFADFNGRIISIVPRERTRVFCGESFVGITCKNKKIIDESKRLAEKLGLVGHNTIQSFFDGKKVIFIEVNPRFGGGASLGIAAGADTPRYLLKILKNKKLSGKIGKFKEGLVMLRYTDDFFVNIKKIK